MSNTSSLTELARFVGQSALSTEDPALYRRTINEISSRLMPRHHRRGVTELLGAVLALSARTRRMVMPPVRVEVDVFSPGGSRAVRLTLAGQ